MIKIEFIVIIAIWLIPINKACFNETIIDCDQGDSNAIVIHVFGLKPDGKCVTVTIENTTFIYDPIMINSVWITFINTDGICFSNISTKAESIFISTEEKILILNVTPEYYKIIFVSKKCSSFCQVNSFSEKFEAALEAANNTQLYPIYNDLSVFGSYCLNNGNLDLTYTGAGYKCNCGTISTMYGHKCEFMERILNIRQYFFNIFPSATKINIKFSLFFNDIIGTQAILTIKNDKYEKIFELTVSHTKIHFTVRSQIDFTIDQTVNTQNEYTFNVILTPQMVSLRMNGNTSHLNLKDGLLGDFRSFYLLLNGANAMRKICIKNLIVNSQILDLNIPGSESCCKEQCQCSSLESCNCHPFQSEHKQTCYCNYGYYGVPCTKFPLSYVQMPESVSSSEVKEADISRLDFGFRTLSTFGTLINLKLMKPPIYVEVQIVNSCLTLQITHQSSQTINYSVSDGLIHIVSLSFNNYSVEMVLDNNLNYTASILNWLRVWPYYEVPTIFLSTLSIGMMQKPYNNSLNILTTCFSDILFDNANYTKVTDFHDVIKGCSEGPKCVENNITCPMNQVCKDNEWQNTKCICRSNFSLVNSECIYNQCILKPCNNGSCSYDPTNNNYLCNCINGYIGKHCELLLSKSSLWWISIIIILFILIIILIILLVYCFFFRDRSHPKVTFINNINENVVIYNEQAGEEDYNGPPINLVMLKKSSIATVKEVIPEFQFHKDKFDNNNKDLILDHPLEYGYEGYNSDFGSTSSIGSKSGGLEYDISRDIYKYLS